MMDLKEIIKKAEEVQAEIDSKATELGKQFNEALEFTDLKLHDVAMKFGATKGFSDTFFLMTQVAFEEFEGFIEAECEGVTRNYIGRTSTFIFETKLTAEVLNTEYSGFDCIIDIKDYIADEYGMKDAEWYFTNYEDYSEMLEDYQTDLDDLTGDIEDLLKELSEDLALIEKAYKYIKDFKDSQVDTYKTYIEAQEELRA